MIGCYYKNDIIYIYIIYTYLVDDVYKFLGCFMLFVSVTSLNLKQLVSDLILISDLVLIPF